MHAEIRIGDSVVMLGDEMPEQGGRGPRSYGGTPVTLFIYRDNVDAAWKKAVDAGATVVMPLADQFWGDRGGCIEDPFGHRWWLSQHVKDLNPRGVAAGGGRVLLATPPRLGLPDFAGPPIHRQGRIEVQGGGSRQSQDQYFLIRRGHNAFAGAHRQRAAPLLPSEPLI